MKIKKLGGLLLAGMLTLAMGSAAFADITPVAQPDGGFTVTVTKADNDEGTHTFEAYQIFKGDLASDNGRLVLSNIEWGTGVNGPALLTELKGLDDFANATDAASVAAAMNDDNAAQVADIAAKHLTTKSGDSGATGVSGLAAGYYLIKDKDESLDGQEATAYTKYILQVVNSLTVTAKTDVPTIDKNIDGDKDHDDQTEGLVKKDTVSVGDSVPYVVSSTVPDMAAYEKYFFVVEDKMTNGLTFNNDIVVKIGGKTISADNYEVITNADGVTFRLVFKNFIQYKDKKGAAIEVTYSATVNENANIGKVSNDNEVRLIYSNNPNTDQNGKPGDEDQPDSTTPTGETPWKKVQTYLIGVRLTKENEEGEKLTGAEFNLTGTKVSGIIINGTSYVEDASGTYYKLKNGTYTETAPDAVIDGKPVDADAYESTTIKYKKEATKNYIAKEDGETVNVTREVDADAQVAYSGLSEGTYTITETKSPEGYNLLDGPVIIKISYTFDETTGEIKWTVKQTYKGEEKTLNPDEATNFYDTKIINRKGSFLPSTGGMGTTILYLVALAVGVISFIGRKAMKKSAAK